MKLGGVEMSKTLTSIKKVTSLTPFPWNAMLTTSVHKMPVRVYSSDGRVRNATHKSVTVKAEFSTDKGTKNLSMFCLSGHPEYASVVIKYEARGEVEYELKVSGSKITNFRHLPDMYRGVVKAMLKEAKKAIHQKSNRGE